MGVQVSGDKDTCSGTGVLKGSTSPLRWGRCSRSVHLHHSSPPRVFCHTEPWPLMGMATAMACSVLPSGWTVSPPSHLTQGWHFWGQMSQWALAPQGSFQTRQGTRGHPSPEGAGAQADTGGALGGTKPTTASSSQGAAHPSGWRPMGPGTLLCTPAPCGAQPTLSTPQGRADARGSPRGESSAWIQAQCWHVPPPATVISGREGRDATGGT